MKIQNVKGCLDYLPKEQFLRNYINDTLKNIFEVYGYEPIETPILNYFDVLAGKYEEDNDILREIYKLSDQGKRNLGLRYDLTVPFARLIALNKNKISLPFKRYEIAKVFRDGPVKLGRDREFTQCDVDVVGINGQLIEAECLNIYVEAFKKLNIDIIIKYNSRNLMVGLIKTSNIKESLINNVITIIDKMDKLSNKEIKEQLLNLGLEENNIDNLFKYFNLTLNDLRTLFENTECKEVICGLEELTNLTEYIKVLGIDNICQFTPTLARGQDYYTGNVFEVYEKTGKIGCAIGGGGRYDKMITDFINDGNIYPAVGISFGLTSIYELLMMRDEQNTSLDNTLLLVPMGDNSKGITLKLANDLRCKGLKVIVEMTDKKVKKCFEWANKREIAYVSVIGEDEINTSLIKIKNMNTGTNLEYNLKDVDIIAKDLINNNSTNCSTKRLQISE